jgi:hypothetical protein
MQAAQVARPRRSRASGAADQPGRDRIQKVTQDNVDVSIEMDMAVQTLKSAPIRSRRSLHGSSSRSFRNNPRSRFDPCPHSMFFHAGRF